MSQNGKRKIGWPPESKHNMRVLLKALLSVAEGELKIDDNPQLQQGVLTQWRTNTELRVTGKIGKYEGTTLQILANMVKRFGDYLEPKDQSTNEQESNKIRNVIHCLEALKLLVDERDKNKKNTPYWKFILKIKDRFDTQEENIRWIEKQWSKPAGLQNYEVSPNNLFQPADKQPIFQIPYLRNPYFKGRDEILNRIHTNFTLKNPIVYIQVITGAGGFGKTQLAAEYAYRNKQEYDIVWWIRSEEAATLASDYANLATELNLAEQQAQDQSIIIKAVLRVLQQNHCWLLVFDNAEDPSQLRDYIPRIGYGHVLITSQKQNFWVGFGHLLPIPELSSNTAVELLLEGTGQTDEQSALELANELGNLPLALAQASAYIRKTGCSIQHYLELFKDYQKDLLAQCIEGSDYPYTITTTWRLAFEQIESTFPAAQTLLNFCAFLAPDEIPLELFRENSEELPENLRFSVLNPLDFENTIAVLRDYCLVQRNNDALSLHRLVQFVTKYRMSEYNREYLLRIVLCLIVKTFKYDYHKTSTWLKCQKYIFHAISVIENAMKINLVEYNLVLGEYKIGEMLTYYGYLAEAEKFLHRAIEHQQVILDKKCILNGDDLENLELIIGQAYHDLSCIARENKDIQLSIDYHQKEYGIFYKHLGENASRTIQANRCIGCTYIAKGEIERGESLIRYSIDCFRHNKDESALTVGYSLILLGIANSKKGKSFEALEFYKQAEYYFVSDRKFGENHQETGLLYYRMALEYEITGDLDSAVIYQQKAKNALAGSYLNQHCMIDSFKQLRQKLGLPDLS